MRSGPGGTFSSAVWITAMTRKRATASARNQKKRPAKTCRAL